MAPTLVMSIDFGVTAEFKFLSCHFVTWAGYFITLTPWKRRFRVVWNIKWDSLISFAWFSCQYVAEKLRYTRNLNQNIISEREKNPKLKCYLSEASLSIRDFFFALLESHGKFFKGLYRVGWHMIYPFHWRLVKAGVDSWEKRLMGRAEKAGVEYICWQSQ